MNTASKINPAIVSQLHLAKFPTDLRVELEVIKARRAGITGRSVTLEEVVPELIRAGITALRRDEKAQARLDRAAKKVVAARPARPVAKKRPETSQPG
jgi:hypothetical protein